MILKKLSGTWYSYRCAILVVLALTPHTALLTATVVIVRTTLTIQTYQPILTVLSVLARSDNNTKPIVTLAFPGAVFVVLAK